jgi:OmpA-OmpF porin, OOP family
MKKIILSVASLLCVTLLFAQSKDQRFTFGINGGLSDYHGDKNQMWFNTDNAFRGIGGLSGQYYLSPMFNVGADMTYGAFGHWISPGAGSLRTDMVQGNLNLRLKFNNGKWMDEASKWQPYVFVGTGFAHYVKNPDQLYVSGNDWTGNAGGGVNYMITEQLGLNYNLNWGYTSRDKRDGISNGKNDQFMLHTVGLAFTLGKSKDTDMDGVGDRRDICPTTPSGVKVDLLGCPVDSDKDGVADYLDKCPAVAGTSALAGCPDADGDGITDADDKCPTVKGIASAMGCPDADGDGVLDADDKCPNVKGLTALAGCPDKDGDGITDLEDGCPTEKGTKSNNGCPDSDGDGIIDSKDACPKVAGTAAANGCPEIKEETKKVFEQALKGVQFETGKDVIKKTSFGILDNVAKIMADNPSYNLEINGHTDSQGDDAKNLDLSDRRAKAVKAYLVSKGVAEGKLNPKGFGETVPKATNDTPAGRAENRRVEFVVKF